MEEKLNKIVILIPALNPNESLIQLVVKLKNNNLNNIMVINDGSKTENKKYFQILKENYNVNVYENEKNLGKGRTIKRGIEKLLNEDIIGIVTVDADGQHLAKDARNVAEKLQQDNIVLGERNLKKSIPIFSKIGNVFSSLYLKEITGVYLSDTQTGLRGIPKKYFDLALKIEGERFDYEMNFLKEVCSRKIRIDLVEIETIYEKRIRNFRIVKDSFIIYKDFFKNLISSIISAIIDIIFFWIFVCCKVPIFNANIFARILSGIFDFLLNRRWVFKETHTNNDFVKFLKYSILFVVQMFLNSYIIAILSTYSENILLLKILINLLIYIVNFFIKKKYIF